MVPGQNEKRSKDSEEITREGQTRSLSPKNGSEPSLEKLLESGAAKREDKLGKLEAPADGEAIRSRVVNLDERRIERDQAETTGPASGEPVTAVSSKDRPLKITEEDKRRRASYSPAELIEELQAALHRVSRQVVAPEALFKQTMYALLTREHQLLFSRAGTAKSLYAGCVFSQFADARTFTIQMTKGTSEEALVGAVNIGELKRGNVIHNTDGSIVQADFAFVDEMFDANDVALRSLLGIFNERQFRKGKQREEAVMHTAIATSNYLRQSDVTEAFIDRFLFRCVHESSKNPYDMLRIDEAYGQNVGQIRRPREADLMPMDHLEYLADIVEGRVPEHRITASYEVLFLKNALIVAFADKVNEMRRTGDEEQPELYISPRTMAKSRDVLNASALIDGRREVTFEDLNALKYQIPTVGKEDEERCFDEALKEIRNRYTRADLKNVRFLMEAHELLMDLSRAIEEGAELKPSVVQRLLVLFGISSLGELTFGGIKKAVQKIESRHDEINALRDGLLDQIELEADHLNHSV